MKRFLQTLAGAIVLLSANAAIGDTLTMQCSKSFCVRERCDDWRENCSAIGTFRHINGRYSVAHAYRVCNEFGDCRFTLPGFPPIAAANKSVGPANPQ